MSLAAQQKVSWKVRIVILPSKTWRSRKCVPQNQDQGDGRRPRGLLHMKYTSMYNLLMMPMYSTHDAYINCCKHMYILYIYLALQPSQDSQFAPLVVKTLAILLWQVSHLQQKSWNNSPRYGYNLAEDVENCACGKGTILLYFPLSKRRSCTEKVELSRQS